jgi:hypothetical protein
VYYTLQPRKKIRANLTIRQLKLSRRSIMSRRKPRGVNGSFLFTPGKPPQLTVHEHPDEKADIERNILTSAIEAARLQQVELYDLAADPIQNVENHFDFTLPTPAGDEYLDLVEVVLPGGYVNAPPSIQVGDMADHMLGLVKKKSRRYGARRRSNIHLLLYSTDWKFLPSESVISLVSLYCHRRPHGFKTVAVVAPIFPERAVLWRVFPPHPTAEVVTAVNERELRSRVLHQFSPLAAEQTTGAQGIVWRLPG